MLYLCRLLYLDGRSETKLLKEGEFNRLLSRDDVIIISSYSIPNFVEKVFSFISKLRLKGIKNSDLIDFSKSMSVMLRAGVPLTVAVEDYADVTTSRLFKRILKEVLDDVVSGESLSNALEKRKSVFPNIMVRVVRIGEETGNLEKAFLDIADHLSRIETLKGNIKRALMYPVFVLFSTFGALVFWLVYVLPKITKLFVEMDIKLPGLTLFVMGLSRFTQRYFIHFILLLALVFIFLYFFRKKSEKVAYFIDSFLIKIPVVSLILNNFYLAFVAEYMKLLISAGSSINRTLELLSESLGNRVYARAIDRIRESVVLGESLSNAFSKEKLFPRLFIRMLRSGEESGLLSEQLQFAADTYYEKLNDISQKIGKMLEPFVLIIVGGLFAIIMLSLLMPVYDLVSKLGR